MKCAVEMGTGAMIYINFHKDWFNQSKVDKEKYIDIPTAR
jgi:hypothetical protein